MDLEQLKKRASASNGKYKVTLSKRDFGAASAVDAMVADEREAQSLAPVVRPAYVDETHKPLALIPSIESLPVVKEENLQPAVSVELPPVVLTPKIQKIEEVKILETKVQQVKPVEMKLQELAPLEAKRPDVRKFPASLNGLSAVDILSEYFFTVAGHDEVTPPLAVHTIANDVGLSYNTVRVTLQRMKKSRPQMIERSVGGHWGFIVVSISALDKPIKKEKKAPVEVNYSIDISPLEKRGFTRAHVKQILNKGALTEGDLQKSINDFANDLNFNFSSLNIRSSPIRFFLGILLKGNRYSPVREVTEEQLKKREMDHRALQERLAQKRAEAEIDRQAVEFTSQFEDWKASRSPEFLLSVIKYEEGQFARPKLVQEKEYFRKNVLGK